MALKAYQPPPTEALRQGELIRGLYELQPMHLPIKPADEGNVPVVPIPHEVAIVLSADCDLEWDYKSRLELAKLVATPTPGQETIRTKLEAKCLSQVIFCELFEADRIRLDVGLTSELWRRVQQNQDERFHKLPAAPIGNVPDPLLPDYYLDFKKAFSVPAVNMFEAIQNNALSRIALVPPIFIHNVIQRFYSFLARVGEPD